MAKDEKRLNRIKNRTKNVTLREFEALINAYGYIEEGGRHPKAIVGKHTMPYKRENPVKSCNVRELIGIIESL